jgi:plastocyanin
MTRTRIGLVVGLAVMALAVAGCGGSDDETAAGTDTTATETTDTTDTSGTATGTKLIGSVASDDFTITLTTEDGTDVTSLPAGDYTLEIVDKSDIHNFHLTGPGDVDVMSEVGGQEDEDYPITLVAGSYHFQCDPHSAQMNGDFEVTA